MRTPRLHKGFCSWRAGAQGLENTFPGGEKKNDPMLQKGSDSSPASRAQSRAEQSKAKQNRAEKSNTEQGGAGRNGTEPSRAEQSMLFGHPTGFKRPHKACYLDVELVPGACSTWLNPSSPPHRRSEREQSRSTSERDERYVDFAQPRLPGRARANQKHFGA